LDAAAAAARAAGEVLRRGYGREKTVRYKGVVDLVTEIDEESEQLVTGMLREAFPTYGVFGEEGARIPGEVDARWIVDPLDGTTNYAHNFPFFAVSIALEKAGMLELGVVYNPVMEELFIGRRGGGATLNGGLLHVSKTDEMLRALLATGFPYDRAAVPAALDAFARFTLRAQGVRRAGSAALDLCYVAAGRLDGYYERGIYPWDIAAGMVVLAEAGGRSTDFRGGPPDLEAREIVASNGRIHDAMLETTSTWGAGSEG